MGATHGVPLKAVRRAPGRQCPRARFVRCWNPSGRARECYRGRFDKSKRRKSYLMSYIRQELMDRRRKIFVIECADGTGIAHLQSAVPPDQGPDDPGPRGW